jgi:RNA recognition motif-containing protein
MIIFVANIPFKSRKKDLEDLFKQYGTISRAISFMIKVRRE